MILELPFYRWRNWDWEVKNPKAELFRTLLYCFIECKSKNFQSSIFYFIQAYTNIALDWFSKSFFPTNFQSYCSPGACYLDSSLFNAIFAIVRFERQSSDTMSLLLLHFLDMLLNQKELHRISVKKKKLILEISFLLSQVLRQV